MGDISIIARRLKDGHVQYGWSGNGGNCCIAGNRLMAWYTSPELVDYLFSLGETSLIGKPGSERGGCSIFYTHGLTGRPFQLGETERQIFSKIAFIDYGYFYDTDEKWYYIVPGPFRIKIPLALVCNHLDDDKLEFSFLNNVSTKITDHIFGEYYDQDSDFRQYLTAYVMEAVKEDFQGVRSPIHRLFNEYRPIFDYFDDWVVVASDEEYRDISQIIMKPKSEKHIETIMWQ